MREDNSQLSGYLIQPKPFCTSKDKQVDLFYANPPNLPDNQFVVKLFCSLRTDSEGEESSQRFEREIALLAEFSKRKLQGVVEITRILDKPMTHAGRAYRYGFMMPKYCCLRDYLAKEGRNGKLPEKDAVRLMLSVAETLSRLHLPYGGRSGLTHRDIKPSNLFLNNIDQILVGDLGIAKTHYESEQVLDTLNTRSGSDSCIGTPGYMAPEQLKRGADSRTGWKVDHRTDVHGVGATLFHLLAGRPPYPRHVQITSTSETIGLKALEDLSDEQPTYLLKTIDPQLTKDVEAVVAHCLEKNPEDRYQSCEKLAEDLRRILDNEPVSVRHYTLWDRAKRDLVARKRTYSVILFLISAVAVASTWGYREYRHAADAIADAAEKTRLNGIANVNAERAEQEAKRANQEADLARIQERLAKRNLYVAHMKQVQAGLESW